MESAKGRGDWPAGDVSTLKRRPSRTSVDEIPPRHFEPCVIRRPWQWSGPSRNYVEGADGGLKGSRRPKNITFRHASLPPSSI